MNKPVRHLNLLQIRLPLPGIISILHRVSGVLLTLALPIVLYGLQLSLASQESYNTLLECLAHPFIKLIIIGFSWAFFHHLCAGIRFLLLDLHIGISLPAARLSSYIVIGASLCLTLLFLIVIW